MTLYLIRRISKSSARGSLMLIPNGSVHGSYYLGIGHILSASPNRRMGYLLI